MTLEYRTNIINTDESGSAKGGSAHLNGVLLDLQEGETFIYAVANRKTRKGTELDTGHYRVTERGTSITALGDEVAGEVQEGVVHRNLRVRVVESQS